MSSRAPREPIAAAAIGTCSSCGADLFAGDRFCGGCGEAVPEAADTALLVDLQQVTVGEYDVLGVLGRGGMGLVYLAHDISLGRKVAIKVLPPTVLQAEAAVERFRREARIAASLRHRHITSVFGLKETSKLVFFVMEYVEGRTLDAILQDEGRLAIDVVGTVISDAASALTYAHRREVVHRDLKPANIIVDVEGMAMITDFGVAKVSTAQGITSTGTTVGSPKYMSPEQWSGKATGLSDQYALGCVAYELLGGRAPFEGETISELMKQQLFDIPRSVLDLRPDCPPELATGVMRMLEKEPANRWASLDAALMAMGLHVVGADDPVRETLAQFAKRGHDVRALPKTPRSPIPTSKASLQPGAPTVRLAKRRPGLRWAMVAGAVPLLGVIGYLVLRPGGSAGTGKESVATIALAGVPAALEPGERVLLTAQPTGAAGGAVAAPVTWTTSDSSVARVSADGVLSGVRPGKATLTVASGGKTVTAPIVVGVRVATLEVVPRSVRLAPGGTVRLAALVKDARGNRLADRAVEWASSDPAVVTVAANGVASAIGLGTASVTARSDGQSATAGVSVGAASGGAIATLAVTPPRVQLERAQLVPLRVTARDLRGSVVSPGRLQWASSNPAVAAVSAAGVVSGVSGGSATVTATSEGITSGPVAVTVLGPPAAPGVLQMLIVPAWAAVTIDGQARGQRTRGVDTLSAGVAHRVRFEHDGFATIDTTVTLGPGEQRLLRIQLSAKRP